MTKANLGSSWKYRNYSEIEFWQEYSRRKAEWTRQNPGSTAAEYDKAIKRITEEMGI